jgi:hypothetical protein
MSVLSRPGSPFPGVPLPGGLGVASSNLAAPTSTTKDFVDGNSKIVPENGVVGRRQGTIDFQNALANWCFNLCLKKFRCLPFGEASA